jgi:hypothetical protein
MLQNVVSDQTKIAPDASLLSEERKQTPTGRSPVAPTMFDALETCPVEGAQVRHRLMLGPFFGTTLDRFVPTTFIQRGEKTHVDAMHNTQVIGKRLGSNVVSNGFFLSAAKNVLRWRESVQLAQAIIRIERRSRMAVSRTTRALAHCRSG